MKVTKIGLSEEDIRREKANVGCNICPRCGENKTNFDYIAENVKSGKEAPKIFCKGILHLGYYCTYKGMFRTRIYHTDTYKCLSCNTEWESDPYLAYDD